MRLIDADAEIERLEKWYCEECTRKGNYGIFGAACTPCWVMDAIEDFDNAQTVEAEPVRYGRWIQQESPNGRHFNCSECGHEVCVPCSELIDPRDYVCYLDDYCGKCGALMDGGADNDSE